MHSTTSAVDCMRNDVLRLADLVREAAHDDTVARQLAHVDAGQLPHLRRDAVLLHQRLLQQRHDVIMRGMSCHVTWLCHTVVLHVLSRNGQVCKEKTIAHSVIAKQ